MAISPKGIIFDMDGVLVNSEPFIIKAVIQALAEFGLKITAEDFGQADVQDSSVMGGGLTVHTFHPDKFVDHFGDRWL